MKMPSSVWRFGAVGVLNTAFGLAVIYLAKWGWGWPDVAANMAGYACGIGVGFALNRRWSFRHRGAPHAAMARYLLVLATAYLANLVALTAALDFGWPGDLAQLAGVVPYAVVGYLGSRWFAFASRPTPAEQGQLP
jgi:putative flippase GtrA